MLNPSSSSARLARLRALGALGLRPRLGLRWPHGSDHAVRRVLPLPRRNVAIGVTAVLFAVMCVPLLAVGLPTLGASTDGLTSLTVLLFRWFWLLGWAAAAALPGLALAALLFGREVVVVEAGLLHLRAELLGVGLGADYPAGEVRKLRVTEGSADSGTAWRGTHVVFDFHDIPVALGSRLDATHAAQLCMELQQALAQSASADGKRPAPQADAPDMLRAATAPPVPVTTAPASRLALLGLLAANLLPLAGVLLFAWKVGDIMLVYWAESVIIGLINVVKLVVIGRWAAVFFAPFFLGHYGGFMAMHLMFIMMFFVRGPSYQGDMPLSEVTHMLAALWPALLGLSLSHLLSFAQNFIGRGEYTRIKLSAQMNAPYRRVLVMQFTIILGGMLTLALGSSIAALVLMVALKLLVDVRAHRRERQRGAASADDTP